MKCAKIAKNGAGKGDETAFWADFGRLAGSGGPTNPIFDRKWPQIHANGSPDREFQQENRKFA